MAIPHHFIDSRSAITYRPVQRNVLKPRADHRVYPAQLETQSLGKFQANVLSAKNNLPVADAAIRLSFTGDPENKTLEELKTNANGKTDIIEIPAPALSLSQEPSAQIPYAEYTVTASADGFEPVVISGAQVLPTVTAVQNLSLDPAAAPGTGEEFPIAEHTLYGDYPPKILESEIKPVNESGEIVLSEVVIPEYIVVHDGPPTDKSAENYWIPYKEYIKNVASSEIYATWPEATIQANVLAIQSFTLNRVYTEWYRNKGYQFTITSSTAFDHKFIPERNIFDTIDAVVDTLFTDYLSRPNVLQPILTQYCDGKKVSCPDIMTQWGSYDLGKQGKSAIEILRYYYGSDMYINSTRQVSGVPSSFPGDDLGIGAQGSSVLTIQNQLNRIAQVYSNIPKVAADGAYGENTAKAVKEFQKEFNLPQSGIVDLPTWYKISAIYVAITRIAEYG